MSQHEDPKEKPRIIESPSQDPIPLKDAAAPAGKYRRYTLHDFPEPKALASVAEGFFLAPNEGPLPGYERPFTKALIEEGLDQLPRYLRRAMMGREMPILFFVPSLALPTLREGGYTVSAGLSYQRFVMNVEQAGLTPREVEVWVLSALDFPISLNEGRDSMDRKRGAYLPSEPFTKLKMPWSKYVIDLMNSPDVQAIDRKIAQNLPSLPFETIAREATIHEIGGLIWSHVPTPLREAWTSSVYPIRPAPEISGTYLRNLFYSDGDEAKFAEESFSDKWAYYILKGDREKLASVGRTLGPAEEFFMERVEEYFYAKIGKGLLISDRLNI